MKIPIVNEQDEIIEYKERDEKNPEDIHRVSGLWVNDKDGNILLAQRSFIKKHNPGLWGPAVAGTIEEGETYESCIIREVEEEIGLRDFVPIISRKVKPLNQKNYFGQWFRVVVGHDYPFVKRDEEVEQIKWFSKNELKALLKRNPEIFTPNFGIYVEYLNTNEIQS